MAADTPPPRWLFPAEAGPTHGADEEAARAREHRLLRKVLEGTAASVLVLDTRLRYLYVNPAMARMSGIPAAAFLGRTVGDVLPELRRPDDVLRQVLADGVPREVAVTGRTRARSSYAQRQWRTVYHRLEDEGRIVGLCGIGVEVSGLRQYVAELEAAHERLALLDTAATRVGSTLDVETTCRELADFLVPALADAASVEITEEETGGTPPPAPGMLRLRRMALSAVPPLMRHLARFGEPGDHVDVQRGSAIRRCLDTGEPWVGNLASDDLLRRMAPDPGRVTAYRAAGIHSLLVVPLPAPQHPVGTLILSRAGESPPFAEDDVVVVRELAARAAVTVSNARRYTHEHAMALELQRALLSEPGSPHPDVETASRYLPAGRSALVGGDWYDSLALPDGRTLQVMGDVMGHGFAAAVAMSQYRSLLRTVGTSGASPGAILERADRDAARIGLDRVATCLLALIDPGAGTITAARAGHLPPVLLRPDREGELLDVPAGPPLGTALCGYEALTVRMPPGSVLLLYTDGLVERRGVDIDVSLRALTRLRLPLTGSLDGVLDTLLSRLAEDPAEDDIALLAARLRRNPPEAPA
ncbi:SpoIIE family protein phosphatase [Streptomyces sp. L500]|uniref:SpoIIE family protein phosphatase n=1 Tax=Streptomyces abikoensis TaxID=97398 RepID=UPI0036797157